LSGRIGLNTPDRNSTRAASSFSPKPATPPRLMAVASVVSEALRISFWRQPAYSVGYWR
jgi:hypothetical protein